MRIEVWIKTRIKAKMDVGRVGVARGYYRSLGVTVGYYGLLRITWVIECYRILMRFNAF